MMFRMGGAEAFARQHVSMADNRQNDTRPIQPSQPPMASQIHPESHRPIADSPDQLAHSPKPPATPPSQWQERSAAQYDFRSVGQFPFAHALKSASGASVSVSVHSWTIRVHDQSRVESGLLRRQPSQDCKTRLHHAHRFSSVEYRARWDSRCSRCIDWPPQYSRHVWIRYFASDIPGFAGFVFLFFRTCQTFLHCFIGYAADFVMHVDG